MQQRMSYENTEDSFAENLSVSIIASNEEKNIPRCLNSVKEIADEIVLVHNDNKDSTVKLLKVMELSVLSLIGTDTGTKRIYPYQKLQINGALSGRRRSIVERVDCFDK